MPLCDVSALRAAAILLCLSSWAPAAGAQPAPPPSPVVPGAAPPVLATVPTTPPGSVPQPQSMSGLPLQVGDLPPGVIAVRVIRSSFANNVASQPVELLVEQSGQVTSLPTGEDGRATFNGLAVGERIRVATVLDGERLESQSIAMPAQGGVRVVLVAGIGAGTPAAGGPAFAPSAGSTVAPAAGGAAAAAPVAVTTVPAPPSSPGGWRTRVGVVGGLLVVTVIAWVLFDRRSRASRPAPADSGVPASERDTLVRTLLDLERELASGAIDAATYQTRKRDVMAMLERQLQS